MSWWDQMWGGWNYWWSTIDWGNAPGWVGSILTSASVFLAISLFVSERRRKDRAQVDAFSVYLEKKVDSDGKFFEHIKVFMFNGSDAPLPRVSIQVRTPTGTAITTHQFQHGSVPTIPPKLHISHLINFDEPPPFPVNSFIYIFVRDINGRVWRKNTSSGKTKLLSQKYLSTRSLLV
ncbi:hypothetical protein [Subtercola sp. RTI3]|uniref:hypothetical protein n=1 Tax=Subtercola sp. RTI3 TaxID=3048639 RepID=UPI002B2394FD|nr:hypothetical protein [Subtercola sp. RTI3]MEA9985650.1 hypothetical protein [Subtercola sp. RTI3]